MSIDINSELSVGSRSTFGVEESSVSEPLDESPSGVIEGLPYEKHGGEIHLSYADFVAAIKDRIADKVVRDFRQQLLSCGEVDIAYINERSPDGSEIDSAICKGFDGLAVHGLLTLFSSLQQHDLPRNVVFTAQERPHTPWEGRVQEWLDGCSQPLEATRGMYGMYGPEEYPQLHFRRSDGTDL